MTVESCHYCNHYVRNKNDCPVKKVIRTRRTALNKAWGLKPKHECTEWKPVEDTTND